MIVFSAVCCPHHNHDQKKLPQNVPCLSFLQGQLQNWMHTCGSPQNGCPQKSMETVVVPGESGHQNTNIGWVARRGEVEPEVFFEPKVQEKRNTLSEQNYISFPATGEDAGGFWLREKYLPKFQQMLQTRDKGFHRAKIILWYFAIN